MKEMNQLLTQFAQMTSVQPPETQLFVCDAEGKPTLQLTEEGQRQLLLRPEAFDDISHVEIAA